METILEWSAWTMHQPEPYGMFHLVMLCIGIPIAVFFGWKTRYTSIDQHNTILFSFGILLLLSEFYKQLFHFYIADHGTYDWWIFPFQLCSLPMYLSTIIPFIKSKKTAAILETFLMDICLLGGIMALLFPSGLMHSYLTLTRHSFLWHFILIFIGIHIACRKFAFVQYSYRWTIGLFFLSVGIAALFNYLFHDYGSINMFYISSYQPFSQPFFMDLEPMIGRVPVICFYTMSVLCGLLLVQFIVNSTRKNQHDDPHC